MKKQRLNDPAQRKKLLMLPLFLLPFLTLAFWALGGGRADAAARQGQKTALNLQLPGAQLKDDRGENKLSYYEEAERDSGKWKEAVASDPFLQAGLKDSLVKQPAGDLPYALEAGYKDPNEEKVYQKLAELHTHLDHAAGYTTQEPSLNNPFPSSNHSIDKEDVDRLEGMIKNAGTSATADPEVDRLNQMMDRILDIQHPERLSQKLEEGKKEDGQKIFEMKTNEISCSVSLLDTGRKEPQTDSFYTTDDLSATRDENAVEAVIHETQSVVEGSMVKMRLLQDVTMDGTILPRGSFVFGIASLQGERLHILIHSVRKDNSVYATRLEAYDLDGMQGLYVPGAITRGIAAQAADNSLQNIELASLDPSLKAQATAAGISTAKKLLTKKARLVRVTLKAGYRILLR